MGFASSGPQVSASPSSNLVDGQSVVIRVGGFSPGTKVWISECATAASGNDLGCGAEIAGQAFSITDNDGAASTSFTVHSQAQEGPFNKGPIQVCSDQCVIVATLGGGYTFASAKIAFEAP